MEIDLSKNYCIAEVKNILSLGYGAARLLVENGSLPATRVNGAWRVNGADLDAYIRGL